MGTLFSQLQGASSEEVSFASSQASIAYSHRFIVATDQGRTGTERVGKDAERVAADARGIMAMDDLATHQSALPNLRDLTGLTPSLTPGLVFRSAAPAPTPSAGAALASLGITHIFDLRSATELDGALVIVEVPPPIQRRHVPVFTRDDDNDDFAPEAVAWRYRAYTAEDTVTGFRDAYAAILRAAPRAFAEVLAHLAQPDPTPCLVHCTAGKDRTGVLCALLLTLCGVPDQLVAREYALTEDGLRPLRADIVQRLRRMPALDGDLAAAERMLSAKPESMLATLDMVRQEYGSAEDYVINQCGLSAQQLAQLRRNLGASDAQTAASEPPTSTMRQTRCADLVI
ncbi:hypothetical protein DCS_03991 [Drechmeria coniospora]|uniref:Tyrosine specific protein phosphatases domain-containing protein n=1 Tax=Drechmeria coniospora TaxID=98403 RepID=A0A151GIR8_DRECN|nr:hypothetical protein DCS_03991 [Drechmeria coniospora]KYK56984.1 hypothetical protein DCS_03991 [Drechmeria coniospora]